MGMLDSIGLGSIAGMMGLSTLGSMGSSALQFFGQRETNKDQIGLSREQMAFQERMSSTAYQRAMADMEKAGLNPILAYSQGGASTPGGAMPVISNPYAGASNMFANTAQGIASLAGSEQSLASAENQKAQADATNKRITSLLQNDISYRSLNSQQQVQVRYATDKIIKEIDKVQAEVANVEANTGRTLSDTQRLEYQNVYRGIVADFFSGNEWAAVAKEMGPAASQAAGVIQRVISSFFKPKYR